MASSASTNRPDQADDRSNTRRAEPIDRLRDNVRLLGELVGEVLREQGGPELFEAVEHLRMAAIDLRSGGGGAEQDDAALMEWVNAQSTERLTQLVRAFSVYFHLINLAEQHHRTRTLIEREQTESPLQESIASGMETLHRAGVAPEELVGDLRRLDIHPVFTAHPSEARRRTLLQHLEYTAGLIGRLDGLTSGSTRAALLDELRARTTLIWQTAETRAERPTVLDEVRSILYILAGNLYRVAPTVQRAVEWAVEYAYDGQVISPGELPPVLQFGSWVGRNAMATRRSHPK